MRLFLCCIDVILFVYLYLFPRKANVFYFTWSNVRGGSEQTFEKLYESSITHNISTMSKIPINVTVGTFGMVHIFQPTVYDISFFRSVILQFINV